MRKTPWDFSTQPTAGQELLPNEPSPAASALGVELARLTAPELEVFFRAFPDAPRPCVECAFVQGTIPNQCGPTLMDAIKCVVEGEPFYCHKGLRDGDEPRRLCAGYAAVTLVPTQARAKLELIAKISAKIDG